MSLLVQVACAVAPQQHTLSRGVVCGDVAGAYRIYLEQVGRSTPEALPFFQYTPLGGRGAATVVTYEEAQRWAAAQAQ